MNRKLQFQSAPLPLEIALYFSNYTSSVPITHDISFRDFPSMNLLEYPQMSIFLVVDHAAFLGFILFLITTTPMPFGPDISAPATTRFANTHCVRTPLPDTGHMPESRMHRVAERVLLFIQTARPMALHPGISTVDSSRQNTARSASTRSLSALITALFVPFPEMNQSLFIVIIRC